MSISYYHLVVGERVDFSAPGNERSHTAVDAMGKRMKFRPFRIQCACGIVPVGKF